MASWTIPYRPEAYDRDPGFYWQDLDDVNNDMPNDFLGQFVDFDGGLATTLGGDHDGNPAMAGLPESFLLDHPAGSTTSSAVSTTEDDFDFLSSSSHVGPTLSAPPPAGHHDHQIDPQNLTLKRESSFTGAATTQLNQYPRASMSDTDLSRLEGISLYSPRKQAPVTQPSSPTPPNTQVRKTNKFVEALSSTIRKAGKLRKSRKPVAAAIDRPGSPTMDHPPRALRLQPHEYGGGNNDFAISPTFQPQHEGNVNFVHGGCEDPFNDVPAPPPASSFRFFSQANNTTARSPGVKTEPDTFRSELAGIPTNNWSQQNLPTSAPEHWSGGNEYMTAGAHTDGGWWDLNLLHNQHNQHAAEYMDQHQRNASLNLAMHAHHSELPYEYAPLPDTSTAGLMIHMPQPRPPQPTVVTDISVNAQTYLPPPPPPPATERQHRPPKAPSSGARHLSCSPIRKTRAPSASPTPGQSRHSSGGSVSSVRSASGRGVPPGTPTGGRKSRRSRDSSSGEIGFVNFTPSDGGLLMTGVAPSGSSKTKARREREATERRRRLSEAAMKAVQAAGGDVDKLREQGFAF